MARARRLWRRASVISAKTNATAIAPVPIQPALRPGRRRNSAPMTIVPAERHGEHDPGGGGRAHPCSSRISSTSIGRRRRCIATIRPSPTVTSQAATTITISAKICPSLVAPHPREPDQREVRGVEHQLEAEQDHERVAPDEHAAGADREDQRADREIPGDAHRSTTSTPPPASAIVPVPGGRGRIEVERR